jgi:acetolactate synthase-1/2/3 large subunit
MSSPHLTRRDALKAATIVGTLAASAALAPTSAQAAGRTADGWVKGHMTGARALVETLIAEGTPCVFGIPGAQENELWDEMKSRGLPYLLVTHENSAACMADGCARSTGRPGVLSVVPGPGLTNALSGIGEALLDSIPLVCIVGDVARGDKYRPFQVHELPQAGLLQQVCKTVLEVKSAAEIPDAVRQAFQVAISGEPGPAAVVVPYNLLIDAHRFESPPTGPGAVPFDDDAFGRALCLLSNRKLRVGVFAGLGCMDFGPDLVKAAELLQAPVATSVSGKGVVNECHPLAVGWGFGPQGTRTAENAFNNVDLVLAIGVRFSEVSTAFYAIPQPRHLIHVDINANNLGRILKADVCVHADAGLFLTRLLAHADQIGRPCIPGLAARIRQWKHEEAKENARRHARCGADPMLFYLALRGALSPDALVFVDVTGSEHWAAEAFTVFQPRTYFNPTDNQSMGWSIAAALGAQRIHAGRQVVTATGDGCFLMSAMEISTAARENLPVKFFVLDDQAFHYMQALQMQAYRRTTATILARLDYAALAKGLGVAYLQIDSDHDLDGGIKAALAYPGPVLTRVLTDYGQRPMRWLSAAKARYTKEMTTEQKVRFIARLGSRALDLHPKND